MIYILAFQTVKSDYGEFTPVEVAALKGRTSKSSLGGEIMPATRSMVVALLLTVIGLAGCTDVSDAWSEDLTKAGFTDPVIIKSPGEAPGTIMASAGSCRIRFVIDRQADEIYAEVPGGEGSDDPSFVRSPSLNILKQDERFAPCFEGGESEG